MNWKNIKIIIKLIPVIIRYIVPLSKLAYMLWENYKPEIYKRIKDSFRKRKNP